MSRTTREGPSGNQPDDGDCVVCGDPADGIDAPTRQPICQQCATIRCDGGGGGVELRIPIESQKDAARLFAIEDTLADAGVTFDTAMDVNGKTRVRVWHLDWSLSGATVNDVDRGDGVETDGGQEMRPGRRRVTSSINFGGASGNHVATPGDDVNHLSGEVAIKVSGASTDYPHPTRLQREIEAAVADVLDDYADRVSDDVDRGDGVETDGGGGDHFSIRVGELVRRIEEEVDGSTTAEAILYARCSAAFEHAYNHTDLPPENALGVMTAALFEAADQSGFDRVDVIESAREFVDDDDDADRGDGVETDGGVTTYECDECGDVPRCNVDDAGQRRCPDCGRAVTAIVTDGGREPTKFDEWILLEVEWDCITRRAKARFLDQWEKREDWKNFEARYHLYKAHDQLSVASYHARQDGTDELVKTNIADAVNHMLMAMATLDVDHDECQPVTEQDAVDRGDEIVTDGGLLTRGSRYHVVCSDCTFEDLKRERHQAARAVDVHRRAKPSHDARFEEVRGR